MNLSTHARVQRLQRWAKRWELSLLPSELRHGDVTVGVAYYRTPRHLAIQMDQIRRHSDSRILRRVVVVDNSVSEHVAASFEGELVTVHEFPRNFGHGVALDWAAWHANTEFFIALDSDAWPVADSWLEVLLQPLREGAAVSGIKHERDFIHPSCLAIRTATLRKHRLSFVHRYPDFAMTNDDPNNGRLYWDVGERISWLLRQRGETIHGISADPSDSGTYVGSTYGSVVYHQWYGTRFATEPGRQSFDGIPRRVIEEEMYRWLHPER